jgi:hypothetical protein
MHMSIRLVRTLARPALLLLATSLLCGCGEQADDPDATQSAGQPGAPIDLPATPDQIAKLDAVVERFPEVAPLADQARADGTVTEQEIIGVLTEAERLKTAGDDGR